MLRYTVLRATIGILTIALLVTVPRAATEQSSGLDAGELISDEEPIIIVPEDVCDIEVDPTAVDLLLVDPLNFYATYMLPVPCEPPPAQYKCQGCRDKRGTVYECYQEVKNAMTSLWVLWVFSNALQHSGTTNPVPDEVIRRMREADALLMTTGYTAELLCERENVLFREERERYLVSATIRKGEAAMRESRFSHLGLPSYQSLKNYLTNTSPQIIVDGKPWMPYPEGSPLPHMRPAERIYYEHKNRKLFVQAMRNETVWIASDNRISRTDPAGSNLSVFIERSRRWSETATWFDRSMHALGRFVASMLGKGRSASWQPDGRIQLVADHHQFPEWEWHLVVDPRLRYLTVQAELVDRTTKKVLERWQNSGVMSGEIPLAHHAVWTDKPNKSPASLVVECRSYDLCFDEKFYEETFQRIKKAKFFRDMRVEPFMDIRVGY